jgi:hypothetical protein
MSCQAWLPIVPGLGVALLVRVDGEALAARPVVGPRVAVEGDSGDDEGDRGDVERGGTWARTSRPTTVAVAGRSDTIRA